MISNPVIDVIIPVYNREKYIRETIESILEQSWQNINIVLVDDGSTDASREIINEFTNKHSNIQLISKEHNSGISDTSNIGLHHTTAEYIAFLDSDDLWDKEKLFKQMQYLKMNDSVDICFTLVKEFDHNPTKNLARKETFKGYHKSAMLCRSYIFKEIGEFDTNLAVGEFIDWLSRCSAKQIQFGMLEEILTYRRVHESNFTKKIKASEYLEVIRAHMKRKSDNAN